MMQFQLGGGGGKGMPNAQHPWGPGDGSQEEVGGGGLLLAGLVGWRSGVSRAKGRGS